MIAQANAIANGAISADWTLTGSFYVMGFLLVAIASMVGWYFINTLKEMKEDLKEVRLQVAENKDDLEEQKIEYTELKTRFVVVEARQKLEGEQLADMIIAKMRAANGR